jgi:hypothetical protein
MAKTIWKYPLPADDGPMKMPQGAEILCVQMQNENPTLWVLVEPNEPMEERDIRVYGTGHPVPGYVQKANYIGTVQMMSETLVFHVFEVN